MKRFGSLRNAAAVLVLCGLVAVGVAVASAQAAPSKKNFTVQVAVTNAANPNDFTVTIRNDGSSNTTLGSVNVTLPTGFTASSATPSRLGWSGSSIVTDVNGTSTLLLRSATAGDALTPGAATPLTVAVHVSTPTLLPTTCDNANWTATAKQSNDYNGTNNWFTLLTAKSDMEPLGSFTIGTLVIGVFVPQIGTQIGDVFAPAIQTGITTNATVNALDTCGNPKTNYAGPTTLAHNLDQATVSGPDSWSSGIGTISIKPTISETERTVTLTDTLTSISGTSDPSFDTQQRICTSADALTGCGWRTGDGSIQANSPAPTSGSLGVGFNPLLPFSCNSGTSPLGKTVITISPHGTSIPGDVVPYQVTLQYSKQASGTGNANSFVFCETTQLDGTGWTPLPLCSTLATGVLADCVVDQKRITGGALQVILSLLGDPYVGGK